MSPDTDAQRIARGEQPAPWEGTFKHPFFGELTFTAGLPDQLRLLRHSVQMDNLLDELGAEPSPSTRLRVAALAGLAPDPAGRPGTGVMIDPPVVRETREAIADDGGERIVKVYYDALADTTDFPIDVWTAYSKWRFGLLEEVLDDVKGPSGTTDGSDSKESSDVPTDSRSTTLV